MNRDEANAVLALKHACNAAVDAAGAIRELAASVDALPDDAPLASLDLEAWARRTAAQAMAVQALHGLVEEIRRTRDREAGADAADEGDGGGEE